MNCRLCRTPLQQEFLDLGNAPPSNAFLTKEQLQLPEVFYPLKLWVCETCLLVQIDEYKRHEEIFRSDYAYFSSYSSTWLAHASAFVEMFSEKLGLNARSCVIEVASNDGYLLQYVQAKGFPCLGIEPSSNTAQACRAKGISVIEDFFGARLAATLPQADLLIGNNVFAHVPDLNDFVQGLAIALKPSGIISLEFPHLMRLIGQRQFDTIYHEHFSYFSLHTVHQVFQRHGLTIYDVQELPTHGGSLRVLATHADNQAAALSPNVAHVFAQEELAGLHALSGYRGFQQQVNAVKDEFLRFLLEAKRAGKRGVGYGAAAKGNTLLNYCGVKKDLLAFVADKSPHKQGKYLPGSHIPVVSQGTLADVRPDYVVIFPWNIKEEIMQELSYIRQWGGQFVTAIPSLHIF